MADHAVTAASVRALTNDPEDTLTLDAKAGWVPTLGQLAMMSGDDEVDAAVAGAGVGVVGMVIAINKIQTTAGVDGYRVTCLHRGLVDGFTGLAAGEAVQNSANAGAVADTTVVADALTVGMVITPTQIFLTCPVI